MFTFNILSKQNIKKTIVRNYNKYCSFKVGQCLLYYKTDPFYDKNLASSYVHTNNWEILEICKILNILGYTVDIVDRTIDPGDIALIDNRYDIYIGLGAGNSGKYFYDIGRKLTKALKIFYAAGPEPDESNKLIIDRYKYFFKRHPDTPMQYRRMIDQVNVKKFMSITDSIFSIGNQFSINTYKRFKKPIYRIYPSTAPQLNLNLSQLSKKDVNTFLYFGGNGNIVKGLDLLIEVFSKLPHLKLIVCAPHEEDFDDYYLPTINNCKNIQFLGFIEVGSKIFDEITSQAGFVILPSCSEGTATSVVTCMRRGLIPVVTYEAGIDIGKFGYLIKDLSIKSMIRQITSISKISNKSLIRKILLSYSASFEYTQANFSRMFTLAIIDILLKQNKLNI